MARRRASMREGPLAELFRATEAAQRQQTGRPDVAEPEQSAEERERPNPVPPEAPVKGESVLKYDPTSEAAEMYRDLAKEVLRSGSKARVDA